MIEILLITNKNDITTDFIVKKLNEIRQPFYRLNTEDIGSDIKVTFDFSKSQFFLIDTKKKISINLLCIRSVYFRRPEIHSHQQGLSIGQNNFLRAELLFTLEGLYKILDKAFWISNVYSIRDAENKIYQLLIAQQLGFTIPESLISNQPDEAELFFIENNKSCIIKPIKSGLVEGIKEEGVIFTSQVVINANNKNRINACPVYLQTLVPKNGDIRVTVVGNKLFPALIHSQENNEATVDWRRTDAMLKYSKIKLPKIIIKKCRALTKKLKLNFAAIDFILDNDNNYIFLEINPNGQWAWIEKQLNFKISNEITTLLVKKKS